MYVMSSDFTMVPANSTSTSSRSYVALSNTAPTAAATTAARLLRVTDAAAVAQQLSSSNRHVSPPKLKSRGVLIIESRVTKESICIPSVVKC